jgi:hypothetical protein
MPNPTPPLLSESDVRKREQQAFITGARWRVARAASLGDDFLCVDDSKYEEAARREYPLPVRLREESVKSEGEKASLFRYREGRFEVKFVDQDGWLPAANVLTVVTPERVALWHSLYEHPTEPEA